MLELRSVVPGKFSSLTAVTQFVMILLLCSHGYAQSADRSHPDISGTWTYRSFISDPDVSQSFDNIRFGAGIMRFEEIDNGKLSGRLSFGPQFQLSLNGWASFGNPPTLRFRGVGDSRGTRGWIYDYIGYYIPEWPNGVGQRPAIVGTIVRTATHSNGQAPAGVVATWISVRGEPDADSASIAAVLETVSSMAEQNPEAQSRANDIQKAKERLRREWEDFYLRNQAPESVEAPDGDVQLRVPTAPQQLSVAATATATFQEPDVIRSQNGELHAILVVKYGRNQIGDDPINLRSYNGKLVGPTLRARPGDILFITLRNELDVEPPHSGGHNDHHGWNTTNLHTHGLHVSPSGNSDNVFIKLHPCGTQISNPDPDEHVCSFDYKIEIPLDHPAGTFWYHAHKHGAVASQVSSGMSGALIIEGGMDDVLAIKAARERVLVLQQIPYWNNGLAEGVIELPYMDRLFGPGAWDNLGRFTTINGIQLPVITMRPGEVQRWRLVNSGFRENLNLKIEKAENSQGLNTLELNEIAADGLSLGRTKTHDVLEIWPGGRSDLLVQAPAIAAGEYFIVDERTAAADSLNGLPESRKYVAKVVIKGTALSMALPADSELAGFRLPSISPGDVTGSQSATYGITVPPLTFAIDGRAFDPNHSRKLTLGDVEEWTLQSINNVGPVHHPFHIHVNPFEVYSMSDENGVERLDSPTWRDTVLIRSGWTVKFRTRYKKFTGAFVQHCHILDHEDQGMMETLEIRDAGGAVAGEAD